MQITFSQHALRQLAERQITTHKVEQTILYPDKLFQQDGHRWRAIKTVKKQKKQYCLVVIYDTVDSHKVVVTAFLTSKLQKYL